MGCGTGGSKGCCQALPHTTLRFVICQWRSRASFICQSLILADKPLTEEAETAAIDRNRSACDGDWQIRKAEPSGWHTGIVLVVAGVVLRFVLPTPLHVQVVHHAASLARRGRFAPHGGARWPHRGPWFVPSQFCRVTTLRAGQMRCRVPSMGLRARRPCAHTILGQQTPLDTTNHGTSKNKHLAPDVCSACRGPLQTAGAAGEAGLCGLKNEN